MSYEEFHDTMIETLIKRLNSKSSEPWSSEILKEEERLNNCWNYEAYIIIPGFENYQLLFILDLHELDIDYLGYHPNKGMNSDWTHVSRVFDIANPKFFNKANAWIDEIARAYRPWGAHQPRKKRTEIS